MTSAAIASLGNSSGWLRLRQSVSGVSRAIRAQKGFNRRGPDPKLCPGPSTNRAKWGLIGTAYRILGVATHTFHVGSGGRI